jgi:phage-related protein
MYALIDGVDTQDYKLRVTALPPIQIAQKRVELITIPGRSGYLTQWDGSYEEVAKTAAFFYKDECPEAIARLILEGKTITFSNEPDKVYDYRIDIATDLIKTISTWHQFEVQIICNPVKREIEPASITAGASPIMLISPCNHPAYPTITLTGTGDVTLTVGDQEISLTGISPSITIDGDLMECYQSDTLTSDKMTGDFPVIGAGETISISWTGSVTKAEILPNWRWV